MREAGQGVLPALAQQFERQAAERALRFPDLAWAERIVESELRGARRTPNVLKMARGALALHGRLTDVELEIRDRIASERGATTVQPRG